jgi:hypothetical protein
MKRSQKNKKFIEETLKMFPLIQWDRYHLDFWKNTFDVFGWIKREDTHEDFVFLFFKLRWFRKPKLITSVSSSAKHGGDIIRKLEGVDHVIDCQRVEHTFNIKNMIKLSI